MKIKLIIIAVISIAFMSCEKQDVGVKINESAVTIRGNDTWLVAGRGLNGDILNDNRINLVGAGVIYFTISVSSTINVPLECYFSIEDPLLSGAQRTIIKTNPVPKMTWDPTQQKMSLAYSLNVAIMASGREYIGHIVINGPAGWHQQTDYLVRR